MKSKIIVDSSTIREYLKTGEGKLPVAYEKYEMKISAATYTELLASETFTDAKLAKEVMDFVDKYFTVEEVTKATALLAAEMIREYKMNFASAMIAATAVNNGYELLTNDKKTYEGVSKVKILDL